MKNLINRNIIIIITVSFMGRMPSYIRSEQLSLVMRNIDLDPGWIGNHVAYAYYN